MLSDQVPKGREAGGKTGLERPRSDCPGDGGREEAKKHRDEGEKQNFQILCRSSLILFSSKKPP